MVSVLAVAAPTQAHASTDSRWRTVTFDGVSVRVPALWPVIRFSRHPEACPRLDVHAVYLGAPGPMPICPPHLLGKTEAVMISPLTGSVRSAHAGMITNSDWAITRTIVDQLPHAGVTVTISYRSNRHMALSIQASIRIGRAARHVPAATRYTPAATAPGPSQGIFIGNGFDTCAAPSRNAMTRWLSSGMRAVGIYIGGINRACAQQYLTPGWLRAIQSQGWRYFPIYPGLQASCVLAYGDATITTRLAAAEGTAAADDAAIQAASLGIPAGTPLIYDMEAYAPACDSQVITFLNAWDTELHVRGYQAGVYESFTNISALVHASGAMTEPDVTYYADWDNRDTTLSGYMPPDMWAHHQRLHQYRGGHLETHGGVTLDIDSDRLNVQLGKPAPPSGNPVFRATIAINANGTAEWFARNAVGTLVHAWQHPVGSLTFTAMHTVGRAPRHIVSNPTVARQPGGALAIFARDSSGHVVHAWQQAGFPNDWEWGSPLPPASRKARPGTDPASVVLPNGRVEVYQTATTGAILTATQRAANNDFKWTRWGNIKGNCASTPAAVTNAAHDALVFCVTRAGQAAVNSWNGRHWSKWSLVGASPSGLSGAPAVTVNGSGEVELITATTAGVLERAWQSGAGTWTWQTPVTGPGQGGTVTGTPSAITAPSGQVVVFTTLSSGQVGQVSQQGSSGSSAFGSWSVVAGAIPGGKIFGSPAAWRNTSGPLGVAVLDGDATLATSQLTGESWSEWLELGGGI